MKMSGEQSVRFELWVAVEILDDRPGDILHGQAAIQLRLLDAAERVGGGHCHRLVEQVAGSLRDDGPLTDTIMDLIRAQEA